MNTESTTVAPRHVVVTSTKSVGIQIMLIFFFGPLGLFYSTVKGALIMLIGVPAAFFTLVPIALALLSAGLHLGTNVALLGAAGTAILLFPVLWIGSWIWGVKAVNAFNRKLTQTGLA